MRISKSIKHTGFNSRDHQKTEENGIHRLVSSNRLEPVSQNSPLCISKLFYRIIVEFRTSQDSINMVMFVIICFLHKSKVFGKKSLCKNFGP